MRCIWESEVVRRRWRDDVLDVVVVVVVGRLALLWVESWWWWWRVDDGALEAWEGGAGW